MKDRYANKWFVLSVLSLGLGGAFALIVGLARAPFAEKYLPHDYFQHALVGHVNLAILFWLLLSTVVVWSVNFRGRGADAAYALAALGTGLVAGAALFGGGDAVMNNYVPALVNPVFFAGLALFFAGFSINSVAFANEAAERMNDDDPSVSASSAGVMIGLVLLAAVVISLAKLGGDYGDYHQQVYYERLFWTPGHIQQFLNGAMLAAVWYALAGSYAGGPLKSWAFLKVANKALVASAALLLCLLFVFDPLDKPLRVGAEIIYAIGLGVPLFLHIANILRQVKPDFKNPVNAALTLSMGIYLYGIFIAYAGFQNDTRVPAHYHGAVTALTLALMGYAYDNLIRGGLSLAFPRLAKAQLYLYGVGMALFISGLFVSGLFGAPRKTPGTAWTDNPVVLASMSLMGVGTLLSVLAGAAFVLYVAVTLFKNRTSPPLR